MSASGGKRVGEAPRVYAPPRPDAAEKTPRRFRFSRNGIAGVVAVVGCRTYSFFASALAPGFTAASPPQQGLLTAASLQQPPFSPSGQVSAVAAVSLEQQPV